MDFTADPVLYSLVGRDRRTGATKHKDHQLVVDVELVPAGGVNFGARPAQAASAFWTAVLLVPTVVDVVELAAPEDPRGKVTPWSFRQLR